MMSSSSTRAAQWRRWHAWGPWALLVCVWLTKTWEILRHFTDRHYALWGAYFDTLEMVWMSWWTSFTENHPGQSLFFSTWTNFPNGAPTELEYGLAYAHVLLAGELRAILGGLAAHNLVAVAGCAFTLVSLFVLFRYLSGNGWFGAGLAALVFTFGLGAGGTLPDLELIYFGYTALVMLAWLRAVETGGWWRLALTAALVAWTCFTQMYYGLSVLAMLSVAACVSLFGLSLPGIPSARVFRRTLFVLGAGLALASLVHLGNIGSVMGGPPAEELYRFDLPPYEFPISAWARVGTLAFLGGTLWIGIWLRLPVVIFWGALVTPVAVLSLGGVLAEASSITVPLPLHYLQRLSPILGRITFAYRFVPATLMGMAAMYALLWRHRDEVLARLSPRWTEGRVAAGLLLVFWIGAAFTPVVPLLDRVPQIEGTPDISACGADYPDVCTITQRWTNLCEPPAGSGRPIEPAPTGIWALGQLLRPFRPQATVPLPEPPPCIRYLMEAEDDDALLEFSRTGYNGYRAYYQTFHERPLAAFPIRGRDWLGKVDPTPFTFLPLDYLYDRLSADDLPAPEALEAGGIGWVSLYRGKLRPYCNFAISFDGFDIPWLPDEDDFAARYGPPVCEDEVLTLYRAYR